MPFLISFLSLVVWVFSAIEAITACCNGRVLWWAAAVLWNWTETASPSQQRRAFRTGTMFPWPPAQNWDLGEGERVSTSRIRLPEPSLSTKQGPHEGDDTVTVLGQDKPIPESQEGKSIAFFIFLLSPWRLLWFLDSHLTLVHNIFLQRDTAFSWLPFPPSLFLIPGWQLKWSNISI